MRALFGGIVIAMAVLTSGAPAAADSIHRNMTITDAIEVVRGQGVTIAYSSRLVKEWMSVREQPHETDQIAALRDALSDYSLDLVPTDSGTWLIVAAEKTPLAIQRDAAAKSAPVVDVKTPPPLDEITIVASVHEMYSRHTADQFLTEDDIRLMPHIADDAYRALHNMPGVAASDFQAPFYLRGGAINEVKFQLDGIEMLEPFHMRTLYEPLSIIDPGIIGEARVLSGGFTSRHGNYMSGVIDVATERPDSEPKFELGVSFVSAFARSSGMFNDERGSYFISVRRGYLDLLADAVTDEGEELTPRYGDLFAKTDYWLNDAVNVSASTLLASDKVSFVDPNDGEDFGEHSDQQHFWLTTTVDFDSGISSNTSIFSANIESVEDGSQINPPFETVYRYFNRDIDVFGVQSNLTVPIGEQNVIEVGAVYRDLSSYLDYRLNSLRQSDFVNNGAPFTLVRDLQTQSDGAEIELSSSYRHRMNDRFIWELGVRWDRQTYTGDVDDTQVSPRFNALYKLSDRAELRLAWGDFYQANAIQDLALPDGDTSYYEAERAEHRVIGLRYHINADFELQADVYQKLYKSLRPRYENLLDIYEFAPESNFDRTKVDPQTGQAYGAELTLKNRNSAPLNWWLNYTWSKAEDEIDGVTVLRSWDQRNAVTANVTWRGELWSISAIARYHSGWPRTPLLVEPVIDANDNVVGIIPDLSQRNVSEFDDYSRVDLRISRSVPLSRGSFEYYLEVFNVFDVENLCCTSNHTLSFGQGVSVSPQFDQYLPLFPSFGFIWRFGPGADSQEPGMPQAAVARTRQQD